MAALKVDDALQAIAALQQEKAELLAALKRIREFCGDPIVENICNDAIAKAERAK